MANLLFFRTCRKFYVMAETRNQSFVIGDLGIAITQWPLRMPKKPASDADDAIPTSSRFARPIAAVTVRMLRPQRGLNNVPFDASAFRSICHT